MSAINAASVLSHGKLAPPHASHSNGPPAKSEKKFPSCMVNRSPARARAPSRGAAQRAGLRVAAAAAALPKRRASSAARRSATRRRSSCTSSPRTRRSTSADTAASATRRARCVSQGKARRVVASNIPSVSVGKNWGPPEGNLVCKTCQWCYWGVLGFPGDKTINRMSWEKVSQNSRISHNSRIFPGSNNLQNAGSTRPIVSSGKKPCRSSSVKQPYICNAHLLFSKGRLLWSYSLWILVLTVRTFQKLKQHETWHKRQTRPYVCKVSLLCTGGTRVKGEWRRCNAKQTNMCCFYP